MTRLLVSGSVVEARVASASAAAAAAVEGYTYWPAALMIDAVGRFQGTPSGAPVHTDEIGAAAPRCQSAACVLGALVRALMPMSLPIRGWSPPGTTPAPT